MYIYSHNDNKRKDKPKFFLVIVLTVFVTVVVVQNIIILMNEERKSYAAERLSDSYVYSGITGYGANAYGLDGNDLSQVIENVKSSTVGISLLEVESESMFDINAPKKWGMGTGVIVSRNGYILTNQHLAQSVGGRLVVTLNDGTSTKGRVVWNEENLDLAIIKIDKRNLKPVPLGNSSSVYVGDDVIAIGNPLGIEFQGTTTKGIISGLNRTFLFEDNGEKIFLEDLIQTDASINPGNSGGPLINTRGEVIGINTVKLSDAEGIGFAVPVNVVKPIISKLEQNDSFDEAYLGIYAYDSEVIPYMENAADLDKGIYISKIDEYGPCGGTGMKVGDIIVSIDGVEINKMTELREYIYSKVPGDEVLIKLIDGEEKEVKVTLGRK